MLGMPSRGHGQRQIDANISHTRPMGQTPAMLGISHLIAVISSMQQGCGAFTEVLCRKQTPARPGDYYY
eukprot:12915433-Prorocentrum_lima.AAC.1